MLVQVTLTGDMEVEAAGKEGSGAHVLNYLGGSIYLTKECCPDAHEGAVKEAIISGQIRKADFGFNINPRKVILKVK